MEKLITAVIITKNEEKMLPGCLKTLNWADEILVVDTGSTDKTISIAKKHNARVVKTNKKTFPEWRNIGLKEAKGNWIFYVDADERVPEKLKSEIKSVVEESNSTSWYAIPRSNVIFGREFRHGGWWPDHVKRLFKKESLKKWVGNLHEEPVTEGEMGYLENYLMHDKHEDIFEMVEKTNKWSAIEGQLMFDAKHPPMNITRFLTGMFREFWYRMIVKKAFLDGGEGVIMAIYQVFSRFCSYAKLWELQIENEK